MDHTVCALPHQSANVELKGSILSSMSSTAKLWHNLKEHTLSELNTGTKKCVK